MVRAGAKRGSKMHERDKAYKKDKAKQKTKAKQRRRFAANTVDSSVWAITKRLEEFGKLPIPELKFAKKLQAILIASAEEKFSQFELTKTPKLDFCLSKHFQLILISVSF